jgi:hypothetical protein
LEILPYLGVNKNLSHKKAIKFTLFEDKLSANLENCQHNCDCDHDIQSHAIFTVTK